MKKIYYLSTCDDCRRMIKQLGGLSDFEKQEIKTTPVTPAQLKLMHDLAGSYDALFSRKAIKYRSLNLKEKQLTETEIRDLILNEYTFLKRPVIIVGNKIFIGHQQETMGAIVRLLKS